jgi:hypothetical protein
MRHGRFLTTSIAIGAMVVLLILPHCTSAQSRATETTMTTRTIPIPPSIQTEHEAIHAALGEATHAPGRVGTAAKELAAVLHPHFVREEQIAMPPLGLLAPLAAGDHLPDPVVSAALAMTDSLRAELPRMLAEHKAIRAAVDTLRLAAQAEQAAKYEQLADQLALHAQTEEEVLYPAAILVWDLLGARRQNK